MSGWVKFRHRSDVRCTTALAPKAEIHRRPLPEPVMSQLRDGRIAGLALENCGSPSHSALPRDVDWQVLDARLLNRLWVELHQRQYFLRHTHFDGEPKLAGFSCSKRVVMRPMSTRKLIREGFRSRLVHSWRQKLYSTSFNLRESLLSHIGENQREVEDISDGLRVAGFDDTRSRKSSDLWIDRTEHREFTQHDLVSGKCNQCSTGHGIDRNIDGYFGLVCFHCAGDLHRREHKTTGRVEHEIDRHIVGRLLDRSNDCLGTLQINVPRDGKAENAAFFL